MKFKYKKNSIHTNVLIIGVNSEIGSALYRKLAQDNDYNVFVTSRKLKRNKIKKNFFKLDLNRNTSILKKKKFFHHVIFCAGITSKIYCEKKPIYSKKINVDQTSKIIEGFSKQGSHIIFLSSSDVFDGKNSFYNVQHKTNPTTVYGRHKEEIEKKFKNNSNVAILRLTKVISNSTPFIKKWKKDLKNRVPIKAYNNFFFSPIKLDNVINAIIMLIRYRSVGIFHLGGKKKISYFQFAKKYFKGNSLAIGLLKAKNNNDIKIKSQFIFLKTFLPSSKKSAKRR